MQVPHRTAPHLLCLTLCLSGTQAWAACTNWNAGYGLTLTGGHQSEELHHAWTSINNCPGFTFNHYAACHRDDVAGASLSSPTTPTGTGVTCETISSTRTATSANEWVYRSNRKYASTIFACSTSPGCTGYYGDGTNSTVSNNKDSTTTQFEHWLLVDVSDYSDNDRVVDDDTAATPTAVFYPDGWDDEGYLGLWYLGASGKIWYQETTTPGWLDFVTDANWDTPARAVAQGNTDDSGVAGYGDFYLIADPWVIPAVDGSTPYIRLYLRSGTDPVHGSVHSIDSTDQKGEDFGLECTSSGGCTVTTGGTCAHNDLCDYDGAGNRDEMCPSGTTADSSSCYYINHALHGRVIWNTTDDGAVDFANDTPYMFFTGAGRAPYCQNGPDDVFEATWSPGGQAWQVGTYPKPYGGSVYYCPKQQFTDDHDPYILPLPNGGFKGYYNKSRDDGLSAYVCYSADGSPDSWEDCVEIVMGFQGAASWDTDPSDDGPGDPDPHVCVGDTVMFAYQDGGTRHEGGFTVPHAGATDGCFDTGEAGIIFIEHEN